MLGMSPSRLTVAKGLLGCVNIGGVSMAQPSFLAAH